MAQPQAPVGAARRAARGAPLLLWYCDEVVRTLSRECLVRVARGRGGNVLRVVESLQQSARVARCAWRGVLSDALLLCHSCERTYIRVRKLVCFLYGLVGRILRS